MAKFSKNNFRLIIEEIEDSESYGENIWIAVGILEIIKAYHDGGFEGYIRPDHGRHIWGEKCRPGYGLYDRALGIMYILGAWDLLDKLSK